MITELNCEATLFRHRATGAQVMSVISDDDNKVFGAMFKTPPVDSTGVAHILEHSVLCGSRDYPLKEPFVELLKGSQQTFLNAMTYPDRTVYPVASCNLSDYYNLMDVYLNAVFFPRAADPTEGPLILAQEGWHFEGGDATQGEGALRCSGVVYNEMKGVYSSPDSVLYKVAQENLFPGNCYGVDSGGDPAAIPGLTFDQFASTHAAWYHPSNGYFWFSGDDEPAARLAKLSRYLDEFERRSVEEFDVVSQPLMGEPRVLRHGYDAGAEGEGADDDEGMEMALEEGAGAGGGKGMVLMNWLVHDRRYVYPPLLGAMHGLRGAARGPPSATVLPQDGPRGVPRVRGAEHVPCRQPGRPSG